MMRRLLIFTGFLIPFALGFYLTQKSQIRSTYSGICNLIEEHFYDNGEAIEKWLNKCHQFSQSIPPFANPEVVLTDFQDLMDRLGSSHFQIYNSEQDQRLWQGVSLDSGMVFKHIKNQVVIIRVAEGSSGEETGFKIGDVVLKINGETPPQDKDLSEIEGLYEILRGQTQLTKNLKIKRFQMDGPPTFKDGVLGITSFRAEYFEKESWQNLVSKFNGRNHLVIDLRSNYGGNFVSMLRALSPFFCKPTAVGTLKVPRTEKPELREFKDSLADEDQILDIDVASAVLLKTFPDYGPCYKGKLDVLITPITSSVSEIFASSLKEQKNARLWGDNSAGEVVLAVWYRLPELGDRYSISIPQAMYYTSAGKSIEGVGVIPDYYLDELKLWETGSALTETLQATLRKAAVFRSQ